MTDYSPLFTAAEQKYDLPPGILAATAQVESSDNPRAVSPQGAEGLMQIMPATAQGLGVNPLDPVQAIDGAGRTWAQNLKAAGGDIDRAAMMYHGGTDPRQWGPKTQAYPHKLAAALGPTPAQEGGDPIEAALSGQPAAQPAPQQGGTPQAAPQAGAPQADPNDPIESALAGNQPSTDDVNIAMKRMYEKGAKTADIVAYGQQRGIAPNADQIDQARKQGFGTVNFQNHDGEQQPQTDQGLGFYEGLTKPLDNAATWLEQGASKIGLDKPINALGSELGLPTNEQAIAGHQAYIQGQEAQGKTPGGIGQFAGEVAGTLPAALATKNPFIAGGLSGALTTKDPNDLKQTAIDAVVAALGGKAAHAVTGVVAGAVAPKISAAVQKLNDLGVPMTPGQIVGGAVRRVEDAATSIPLLGDLVKNAQRRSLIGLNTGVINDRVLAPIGKSLPDGVSGRDAVDFADKAVSNAYQELLPKLHVQADVPFVQNVGDILKTADELPPERAAQVQRIVTNSLGERFNRPGYDMSGQTFKEADSKLGQLARDYSSSPDPEQRKMGSIFRDVQGELRDVLARSNPEHAPQITQINQAFANLVRVEGAAGSAGAKGGIFTPSQLASAVKRFDTSARKKATATGHALLQDVSDPANDILPPKLADSGTGFRTIAAYLLGAGAAGAAKIAPAGIPLALYTKTGQKVFQKAVLAPRGASAQALAKALTKMKTPLAVAGGAASAEASNGR